MRLVTLDSRENGGRPGVWLPSGEILDLATLPAGLSGAQWRPQSVVSVLTEGEEGAARISRLASEVDLASPELLQQWRNEARLLSRAGTQLLTPVRRPGLLLMIPGTSGETGRGYVKNPNSAVGPDAVVRLPHAALEEIFGLCLLGLVIGRPLFRSTPAQALRALAAVTLVADLGTKRVETSTGAARQFPGACIIGPALVTVDEFPASAAWTPVIRINQHQVSASPGGITRSSAAEALAALSADYAFRPGDIVGLPVGVPESSLRAGDRVAISLGDDFTLGFSVAR